jgi:hypothetical protein
MTFQPPPPPPPQGPPPPPGNWGPPPGESASGGGGGFDPKSINNLDWGILGAGLLVFLFSFISFYSGETVTIDGRSDDGARILVSSSYSGGGASAWHDVFGGGFFGWFAMGFAIAGSAVLLLQVIGANVKLPIADRVLTVYLYLAAALFEIISIFVTPSDSYSGFRPSGSVTVNHGAGFWISLILILAGAVLAIMRAQQTDTALPGPLSNIPKIGK